jgi:peptidoglycan/xylan/chitin deacetylase (PgdA/CDA1 family)
MRPHAIGRRTLLTTAAPLAVVGAAGAGAGFATEKAITALGPTARTARPAGPGAYVAITTFRTAPAAELVALTIDDGPTREWTPLLLDILRRRGAVATFFRVGQRAQAAPDLVKRTAEAGHEQGNHTWAHDDLTQAGEVSGRETLERTHELIAKLTGQPPTLCRPPYGRIDSVGLAICAGLHYGVTLWSQHVTEGNAQSDVDVTLQQASPGSIVLAHDGGPEPNSTQMRQLDRLLASMTDAGYRFVTVSALLADQRQTH